MQKGLVICFGETLWDMLPQGARIGGAPLNAAYHLQKLGIDTALVSRVGNDRYGEGIRDFITRAGFESPSLQTDPVHPTSRVEITIQENHEASYDILPEVAWDYIAYDDRVRDLASRAEYLVFGSLIARSEPSRATLEKLLTQVPVKVMDVNLRTPFDTPEAVRGLVEKADILKLNESELHIISGWYGCEGPHEISREALYGILRPDILIVTYGTRGAYLRRGDQRLFQPGFPIRVLDTVGSGDAFLAGFLSACISGASLKEALLIAAKLGAFSAQRAGGCPDYDTLESRSLLDKTFTVH